MNGLHDLGGMQGFGPVIPEPETPVFYQPWHKRVFAVTLAMGALGKWPLDESRHARESLPPEDMITLSYYERRLAALVALMLKHGLISEAELRDARASPDAASATAALPAANVAAMLSQGAPTVRPLARRPRFQPGDRVQTLNNHPATHTRLPRYARGRTGEIAMYHGAHVFADANAHRKDAPAEPLYAVRFAARELWGAEADPRQSVTIDLWEPHLEPA